MTRPTTSLFPPPKGTTQAEVDAHRALAQLAHKWRVKAALMRLEAAYHKPKWTRMLPDKITTPDWMRRLP